jgi:hypothetical protein
VATARRIQSRQLCVLFSKYCRNLVVCLYVSRWKVPNFGPPRMNEGFAEDCAPPALLCWFRASGSWRGHFPGLAAALGQTTSGKGCHTLRGPLRPRGGGLQVPRGIPFSLSKLQCDRKTTQLWPPRKRIGSSYWHHPLPIDGLRWALSRDSSTPSPPESSTPLLSLLARRLHLSGPGRHGRKPGDAAQDTRINTLHNVG